MKHYILFILSIFFVGNIMAATSTKIETILDPQLKIVHYLPKESTRGIFDKGTPPEFSLMMKYPVATDADISIEVVDFFDKCVEKHQFKCALTANQNTNFTFKLGEAKAYGHFTLNTQIRIQGKLAAVTQSSCAILPPQPEKADPFFMIDGKNPQYNFDLTKEYKRIGVGTIPLSLRADSFRDHCIKDYFSKPQTQFEEVVGFIGISMVDKQSKQRKKDNLYPYTDEAIASYLECVREFATKGKDLIKLWILQEETDAIVANDKYSGAVVMANHVLMVRSICKILKEINPSCKIAVVNSCGDDFFYNNSRVIKMLLKETSSHFDYFAIDAYSGNWFANLGTLEPPEPRLAELLKGCQKIASEFQLPTQIINAERGYFIGYMEQLNSENARVLANLNARSMIISKALGFIPYYAHHGGCMWHAPWDVRNNPTPEKHADNGLWRSVYNAKQQFALQPRAALCSFATVTRMLSFTSDPQLGTITPTIYYAHFQRQDGKRVAAVWTTKGRVNANLALPSAEIVDFMGESKTIPAGKTSLKLCESPLFIVTSQTKQAMDAALKNADFPDIKAYEAFSRLTGPSQASIEIINLTNKPQELTVFPKERESATASITIPGNGKNSVTVNFHGNQETFVIRSAQQTMEIAVQHTEVYAISSGNTPIKIATLGYPDNIWPKAALRPERNLFNNDGSNITADFAASWDEKFLYLDFNVQDRIHIQRNSGGNIWRDDCIQIAIDTGNNALPPSFGHKGYDSDDRLYGLALTKQGAQFFAWNNGKNGTGLCDYQTTVERKDNITHYRTAIPWSVLAPLKPRAGTSFGMSFIIWDNNDLSKRTAPYCLGWTEGIAGNNNPSLFKSITLK